jgi:hypothetical protein
MLSSVSKTRADVMNKDNRKTGGTEKNERKSKEVGSHRLSTMETVTRASLDVLPIYKNSPEMKSTVQNMQGLLRAGGTSLEEGSAKLVDISGDIDERAVSGLDLIVPRYPSISLDWWNLPARGLLHLPL